MKKIINTTKAPQAIGPYSQAVLKDDTLYISGQIPLSPETGEIVAGGIEKQTNRVLDNLKAILESENMGFADLLKVSIFLKNLNDFNLVNDLYQNYFSKSDDYPARETLEVAKLPKDVLIEISAIAKK